MSTNLRYLDNYQLRELLGRGGMAEVWKAYDMRLQRYVAIKLLRADLQTDPDFLSRFVREARVVASLRHPNIVQVYDFETATPEQALHPLAYMVIEYIAGWTLAEYIRHTSCKGQFPSGPDLVQLFACLGRAIDYAHARGMVHRDIKPANILLDGRNTTHLASGEPMLTDFGMARLLGGSTGSLSHTWLGTPLYLSPEQARGRPGTALSDIYALGVILYEVCTGVRPFRGDTIPAIMLQQVSAQPPSPERLNPQITPALRLVILRSLAKDPAQRFQSAAALTVALAGALKLAAPVDLAQMAARPGSRGAGCGENPISGPTLPCRGRRTPAAGQGLPSAHAPVAPSGALTPDPVTSPGSHAVDANAASATVRMTPAEGDALLRGRSRRPVRWLWWTLLGALVLLVVLAGTDGLEWLAQRAGMGAGAQSAGQVFFTSSGAVSEHNTNGENDEVIVQIHDLRPAARGYAYYAWLLSSLTTSESASFPLGQITGHQGEARLQYANPEHTNLLALTSRLLVTEEATHPAPMAPTLDRAAWRYYGALPQMPDPHSPQHFSLLDHLRHLLSQDPTLARYQLPGGLNIWLFRNTEKVLEWSGSARDFWEQRNAGGLQRMVIRVLDYLDGSQYVRFDVPPGTPNLVNPRIAPVALLEFDPTKQAPPGYLYHIHLHLNGVVDSPGATRAQRRLAVQIAGDLNNVREWLQQVRQAAKQLIALPVQALFSTNALTLLDRMETCARYAYVGRLDPGRNQVQGGVVQIYTLSQALATIPLFPYHEEETSRFRSDDAALVTSLGRRMRPEWPAAPRPAARSGRPVCAGSSRAEICGASAGQ